MQYTGGEEVQLGDEVRIGFEGSGTVVACLDSGQYSPAYSTQDWSYLKIGMLVLTDIAGLVHYSRPQDEAMTLVRRSKNPG